MPELFRPSRSIYVRLTLWVMLTVLIIFGIITYIVSAVTRDAVVDGTLENTMSRMEISNQRINNVLTGVEVAVENTIPEVESSLETPDKMYDVVRRLLELNPSIVGSTVAFEPDYYPSKGMQFSPYAYKTINGTIETKAYLREEVTHDGRHLYLRVDLLGALSHDVSLVGVTIGILLAEENGACEVGNLYLVEVGYIDMSHAKKGQVLHHLVAQRTSTCH